MKYIITSSKPLPAPGGLENRIRISLLRTAFLLLLLAIFHTAAVAQVVCCPDFIMKDAVEICVSDFNCPGGTAGGTGHTMAACKLTPHVYTVYPNLPGYTYSWAVTGGTPATFTGNPITVTWGSGITGYLTVVINGNGCHDSITQPICLIDGPLAGFTATPNPVCAGTPVNFTNTSAGGGAYLWNFGDGTTSTLANPPAHVYTSPGTYTVTLTATDLGPPKQGPDNRVPCGCSDTATLVITVLNGAGPTIETNCCHGTVCPGDTSEFCTPVVCTTYNWTVAGGTILSGAGTSCIKVKWNATYTVPTTVSLTVPGCGAAPCPGTATLPVPVLYPNLPINGPNPLCAGTSGSFFLPSMPGTYYQWSTTASPGTYSFNDKDRNVAGVNITFNIPGTYQVQCNYMNPLAGCSGSSLFTVNVLPVFSIYGSDNVCQGSSETYYASGNATWSVSPAGATVPPGPGSSKTITWNTPGIYTITASPTATGVFCNTSAIKVVRVVAVPVLNPISGPVLVCPGKNQTYTVSSNVTGSLFSWSVISGSGAVLTQFGPDQSSATIILSGGPSWTIQAIQQIEISPGVFCSSAPQTLVVNKYGPPAVTGPSTVCVDAITTFTASGPTPPGGFQWQILPPFANRGSILSGQGTNTVNIRWHGPPATGVVVSASTCGGSGSTTVTIANPPAMPTITANGPLGYCLPAMPNNLTLSVPATYCSYQWNLNGTPIAGATNAVYVIPNATFSPSTPSYIFSVTVSNCICSVTSQVQVLIGNCGGGGGTPPNPVPCAIDFTINPNPVCENQYATFTATPAGVFQLQWDFGDGATSFESPTQHAYLAAGTYNVTVTATLGTCVATKVHSVTVNPTPVCTITASDTMYCPGSMVLLTASSGAATYQWIKDGVPVSGATGSTFNAGLYGEYWVEVSNSFGCVNISNKIYIYEKPLPMAVVNGEGTVCATAGGTVSFQVWANWNMNYSYTWFSNPPGVTFAPNGSNLASYTTATLTLPGTLPFTSAIIVRVTDTVTGCENYDTLCVTFYETPQLSVNFQSGCEGTPYTLVPAPNNPAQYTYQWSNGQTVPVITVMHAGTYALTITDKTTGCSASTIGAMIHPKPDLSLFPRGCDTICHTDTLHLYIPLPLNALPPFNTYGSAYPLIQWFANGNFVTPIGTGKDLYFYPGAPGTYQISVVVGTVYGCLDTAGVYCLTVVHCDSIMGVDWGDAPDVLSNPSDYPTLMASNGARHNIIQGIFLGTQVDAEPDGQPGVGADCDDNDCLYVATGDDEDGVTLPSVVKIGMTINITVQASVAGFLDGWIDFNLDGNWSALNEHIFITQPVSAGANLLTFNVPATASMGQSYARFRFRTANTAISFNGLVSNGEVEDYPVYIDECSQGEELDFGDAPDMPPVGFNYPTLLSSNGARHVKYLNVRMGALIDGETDGQPNVPSLGDDMAVTDDEDGVVFLSKMYVGLPATLQVTASVPGFLNAWMDYNKDGDWADPGEQIFTNQPLLAGVNTLTFTLPNTALQGKTYSRFRFNTLGGLTYFGMALNGEVEDYQVHACPRWWPVHTNVKHYITIPHDLPNLVEGDVLGVFYQTATGELECGGLSEFNGSDDQMMIAYGDNVATPVKDGFAIGEPIIWKLCSVIKGDANPVDPVYDFTYPNSNGLFVQNGLSALTGLVGLHVTASAMPPSICEGEPVQLQAFSGHDGVAYYWTSDPPGFNSEEQNPVAWPVTNTSYFVHAYDGVFHAYDTVTVTVTQVNPLVEVLPLNNITVPAGESHCYNATVRITTGGSGSVFLVESGAQAQLIAGQQIRLLPGTRAFAGSHLAAKITATGTYCCNTGAPGAPAVATTSTGEMVPDQAGSFFRVYPNPTTGSFTLELTGKETGQSASVEIYGMLGERILRREMHGNRQQFDLSGNQPGVYVIRVLNGEGNPGMAKIIWQ